MTIQEAIATKLPFKRPEWRTWVQPNWTAIFHKVFHRIESRGHRVKFATKEDMMAADWEVQRPHADAVEEIKAVLAKHGIKANRFNIQPSRRNQKIVYFGGIGTTQNEPKEFVSRTEGARRIREKRQATSICNCANCRIRRRRES